jgi:hypothetical protein
VLAGPEQVVGVMNGDIQAAGKLLAELREAYRGLPQHIQVHVTYLLRESTLQNNPEKSVRADTPGTEAVMGIFKAQLRNLLSRLSEAKAA